MPLRVYNTLNKTKEPFQPVRPGKVGIYLCGPTVYKEAHIGHMVGPVIFDAIKRYLAYSGYEVTWVVNITDVDDKLIAESNRRGIPMAQVAEEMTADYERNLESFGIDQIDHMPRATDNIEQIVDLIGTLVNKGFAYAVDGDVFFETSKDREYGKLSNRSADSLQGEGGGAAARKRAPGDFALWKKAKAGEPSWPSPWGEGRPGWHIECSAMARRLLGETFDIHGGGLDLVFPHHENEIAQSECAHGRPMVKYWMHNGLMRASTAAGKVGGRGDREGGGASEATIETKISRSKGAGGLADLVARQGGERIRFFLLRTHYRSTIVYSEEALEETGAALETFYRLFKRYERITGEGFYGLPLIRHRDEGRFDPQGNATFAAVAQYREKFLESMDDDFNTGGAVAELFELARTINRFIESEKLDEAGQDNQSALSTLRQAMTTLRELSGVLGLFLKPPKSVGGGDDTALAGVLSLLVQIRADARARKDFALGDKIRNDLAAAGITLEDRKDATEWTLDGRDRQLDAAMQLVVDIRAQARAAKNFPLADQIRDALTSAGIALEDRAGATEWEIK